MTTVGLAEEQKKIPIAVVCSSQNLTIADRLCYRIKEEIRKSSGMQLVDESFGGTHFEISIIAIDTEPDNSESVGLGIAYTVIYLIQFPKNSEDKSSSVSYYLTTSIGIVGKNRVAERAEGIVAQADQNFNGWSDLLKTMRLSWVAK
jgi:GGDEF domain-containing protein